MDVIWEAGVELEKNRDRHDRGFFQVGDQTAPRTSPDSPWLTDAACIYLHGLAAWPNEDEIVLPDR